LITTRLDTVCYGWLSFEMVFKIICIPKKLGTNEFEQFDMVNCESQHLTYRQKVDLRLTNKQVSFIFSFFS
jgi:hypothetical protein